jgi:hypothetical protein
MVIAVMYHVIACAERVQTYGAKNYRSGNKSVHFKTSDLLNNLNMAADNIAQVFVIVRLMLAG